MIGNWFFGLQDEYMRKSKKELVAEIMKLKAESAKKTYRESVARSMETIMNSEAEKEAERLSVELQKYKKMYADELQKRLELAKMVEEMQNKG